MAHVQQFSELIHSFLNLETSRLLNSTEEEDEEELNLWYVGVFLYSFGAFSLALGVVLQKHSINKEFKKTTDVSLHRKKLKQPIWVLGIVMYGSSGGLLSAALAFAPQSLLTPLMSVVIISNALLARFLLMEPLTKKDFIAVLIIVLAVIATTASAPSTETKYNTEELIELYQEPLFIVYISALLSLMAYFYFVNWRVLRKKKRREIVSPREEFLFSFSYGASAGCWGGLCVTMIKSAITIIQDKVDEDGAVSIFTTPLIYALLAVLVTCWYQQLNWINKGLERFPAVFVVSIEAVLNEIVAVSGGILYFQEYVQFTAGRAGGFVFGLGLGVFGIIVFAVRDNNVGPQDDFFTNSAFCNCCRCCNLSISKVEDFANKSVKSVHSKGDVMFVDESGQEVPEDNIIYDHVQSPIGLMVEGVTGVGRALYRRVSYSSPDQPDDRNFSVMSVTSKRSSNKRNTTNDEAATAATGLQAISNYLGSYMNAAPDEPGSTFEDIQPNSSQKKDKEKENATL